MDAWQESVSFIGFLMPTPVSGLNGLAKLNALLHVKNPLIFATTPTQLQIALLKYKLTVNQNVKQRKQPHTVIVHRLKKILKGVAGIGRKFVVLGTQACGKLRKRSRLRERFAAGKGDAVRQRVTLYPSVKLIGGKVYPTVKGLSFRVMATRAAARATLTK